MIRKKTVLIVEDHPLVRSSLLQLVKQADSEADAHQAGNLLKAQELATAGLVVDIVLLDPGLPDGWPVRVLAGLAALAELDQGALLVRADVVIR